MVSNGTFGMQLLFLHKNLPGQFSRLAPALARDPAHTVWTLGEQRPGKRFLHPGVRDYWYPVPVGAGNDTHPYVRSFEANVRRGQSVYSALQRMKTLGCTPDVVVGHPGWGETLFVKDVFPRTKLLCYWEFFYRSQGADLGFDPEFPVSQNVILRNRMLNATQLTAFEPCDWGVVPTRWQESLFPECMRERMTRVFDGVDTKEVRPDPAAVFQVPNGPKLSRNDEVLTYVARNLEPYRGVHSLIRALPSILKRRPHCRVLVVGEDGVSYGQHLPEGQTYKQRYLDEVGLHSERVHFLGRLSYEQYLAVLQVSSVHLYLTYPFVLSWSFMEALAAGCLVLGSATAPVLEVLRDGENGLLVPDMLDPACVADRTVEALARRGGLDGLRETARRTALEQYDFERVSLPAYERMLRSLGESR